ncbi:MAG: hypothetical protein ACI8QC_001109 [Planctomycetota bacterium]|jgi:hypothetical protein
MGSLKHKLLPLALCGFGVSAVLVNQDPAETVIEANMHHMGDDQTPEWEEAPAAPEGGRLRITFHGNATSTELVLAATSRHVDGNWRMSINGKPIASCKLGAELRESFYPVPAGTLLDGVNIFELVGDSPTDDITFGRVHLLQQSFRELFDLQLLEVEIREIREGGDGPRLPARITVADAQGNLAPLYYADDLHAASRDGVVYSANGLARCELPRGEYQVYATRGSEWSMDQASVNLGQGPARIQLAIERQVDTLGYVAADTHIHTLTFSGHGDSSVEERMVTLAGEGVELAISTDHNHNTDYLPYQESMGLVEFFTTVVGNEVTTPVGHFNAFPLNPEDELPPHDLHDYGQLVTGMRAKGAQVVILNHPRWPGKGKSPFAVYELDPFTGERITQGAFTFDAMELVNSDTEEHDPLLLFRDWFSLLNRGERIWAVGSSDSHTVHVPVGGGRTYIRSASDNPAAIDVDAACEHMLQGHASVAMGIYVESFASSASAALPIGMGDLASASKGQWKTSLRIQSPNWVKPTKAVLFLNGEPLKEFALAPEEVGQAPGGATDLRLECAVPNTWSQDAWAVWVVLGEGIDGPYWPLANDYTLGATNPIFLDFDGDGTYSSPRQTATLLLEGIGTDADMLTAAVAASQAGVAYHLLDLAGDLYARAARSKLERAALGASAVHAEIEAFLKTRGDVR